jgi:hypothetical protein
MVRGDGSIEMPSWVTESSQPVAGVVSAVVHVLLQVIDVALVSPVHRTSGQPRRVRGVIN